MATHHCNTRVFTQPIPGSGVCTCGCWPCACVTAHPVETVITIGPEQPEPRYLRSPYTFTPYPSDPTQSDRRLSYDDIERIAKRVAELLREAPR